VRIAGGTPARLLEKIRAVFSSPQSWRLYSIFFLIANGLLDPVGRAPSSGVIPTAAGPNGGPGVGLGGASAASHSAARPMTGSSQDRIPVTQMPM